MSVKRAFLRLFTFFAKKNHRNHSFLPIWDKKCSVATNKQAILADRLTRFSGAHVYNLSYIVANDHHQIRKRCCHEYCCESSFHRLVFLFDIVLNVRLASAYANSYSRGVAGAYFRTEDESTYNGFFERVSRIVQAFASFPPLSPDRTTSASTSSDGKECGARSRTKRHACIRSNRVFP